MERVIDPAVVLVEDHAVVAEALALLLARTVGPIVSLRNGEALLDFLANASATLVICDIGLPGMSGVDVLREMRRRGSTTPFLALTMHADAGLALELLRSGAQGFVLKSSAATELVRAIGEVLAGNTFVSPSINGHLIRLAGTAHGHRGPPVLSAKQCAVLDLVIKGHRSKAIAKQLGLSVRTVDSHRNALMQLYGVHNVVALVRAATQRGFRCAPSPGRR
jgi:DNA-binding NarL/FixJ family response regulator